MKKSIAVSALAAGLLAFGGVAQTAYAACDIDGIAPYLYPGGGPLADMPKVEIWGNGLGWYGWKPPVIQICGWNNKVWNYTDLKVYIDKWTGDWYALVWLIDESNSTGPQVPWWHDWPSTTACSIQVKQEKWRGSQVNSCSFSPIPTMLLETDQKLTLNANGESSGFAGWLAAHPDAEAIK